MINDRTKSMLNELDREHRRVVEEEREHVRIDTLRVLYIQVSSVHSYDDARNLIGAEIRKLEEERDRDRKKRST